MACEPAEGIGAAKLVAKGEAGQSQVMHGLRELRRQAAANPGEAARAVLERAAQLGFVEAREHRGQLLDDLVVVLHARRIGKKRRHLDVGREQAAVVVDDVGTREALGERLAHARYHVAATAQRQADELAADDGERETHGEDDDGGSPVRRAGACARGSSRIGTGHPRRDGDGGRHGAPNGTSIR